MPTYDFSEKLEVPAQILTKKVAFEHCTPCGTTQPM
jgi:hypothetical protein